MKHGKKQHRHGPHLNDAMRPDGTVDKAALLEGAKAWMKGIESGEVEIVSVSEVPVDEDNDVLMIVRKVHPKK